MYAIARIAGKQFRIEADQTLEVPKLPVAVGATVDISDILFATDGQTSRVGAAAKGIKAVAKVLSHGRDDKIMVHRKKRRKGFEVTKGHRQDFTLLHIESIEGLGAQPQVKAASPVEAEVQPEVESKPKAAPKPKAKTETKKTETKKKESKPAKVKAAKSKTEKGE